MPCTPFTIPGAGRGFICSRGRTPAPKPCAARVPLDAYSRTVGTTQRCCAPSTFLCDHVLASGKTCDAPLCAGHAHQVGKDQHLCPAHLQQRRDDAELAPREPEPVQERLF